MMIIGVPKEVKTDEFRVGLTPLNVATLVNDGGVVLVEKSAGEGSGFSDKAYLYAGAQIAQNAKALYEGAELIVKVKEPQSSEYELLNQKHTLFCYLHLAPLAELTRVLMERKLIAIAYETVSLGEELPLLKPMSEIAGKMAPVVAAHHLSRYQGGEGVLLSGAEGVEPANVLVLGAGNAGSNAAKIALGMGANVTLMNRGAPKLDELQKTFVNLKTEVYSVEKVEELLAEADIVIGAVLVHGGASTPKLIKKEFLKKMKNGSVIVDIAIDQGGISESSRPTTHTNATFVEHGVLHYCVANMPGAYPKTATMALTNATFEYVRELGNKGTLSAINSSLALSNGVNIFKGEITNQAVSKISGLEFKKLESLKSWKV